MHEQFHSSGTVSKSAANDAQNFRSIDKAELLNEVGEPMKLFAFENPCFTREAAEESLAAGEFSQSVSAGNTVAVRVALIISPVENISEILSWHSSASIYSKSSGKAKSVLLWTANEKQNVRQILEEFLGDCGLLYTRKYFQTKTAIHLSQLLTDEEMHLINLEDASR